MKDQIETRLAELQSEYQKGQQRLESLDRESASVRESMLRISGAIQVLRELVAEDQPSLQELSTQNGRVENSA